jgi:hypothetical protein
MSAINSVARKGFAELQGSSMFQQQQVTVFPAEHMLTIVMYGLRPTDSKHNIRLCACLTAQCAFFNRTDSGVLLTVINAQVSNTTLSVNQAAKNVARNQRHPLRECPQFKTIPTTTSSNFSSAGKCYGTTETQTSTGSLKTNLCLCPRIRASSPSGYCSSWWSSTFQPLQELNGPDILYVEVTPLQRTPSVFPFLSSCLGAYGSYGSLASALLYIDVSVRPSSEALFFFGHLLSRFKGNLPQASLVRQATPTAVISSIDLSDAFEACLGSRLPGSRLLL